MSCIWLQHIQHQPFTNFACLESLRRHFINPSLSPINNTPPERIPVISVPSQPALELPSFPLRTFGLRSIYVLLAVKLFAPKKTSLGTQEYDFGRMSLRVLITSRLAMQRSLDSRGYTAWELAYSQSIYNVFPSCLPPSTPILYQGSGVHRADVTSPSQHSPHAWSLSLYLYWGSSL